ncbi:MAG: sigma-70 family RNA polymerase sigma factor [Phycisphaerales bacterium]
MGRRAGEPGREGAAARQTPEQLALRAQQGSLEAFAALVEHFEERLFNFLLRRVGCPADAEDIAQETFVRAWQRIGQYKPRWRFSTWLFTIGSRLAASKYRDGRRPPLRLVGDEAGAVRNAPPAGAERLAGLEDRGRAWAMAADLLTPEQHTAMWLRYAEDMAIVEIARVLGKSQVGVRVMLFRARNVLAARLEQTEAGIELKPETRASRCAGGVA